jgi:sugar-specific transcriptional regulator TrmB
MNYRELEFLGLSEKEAKVYLASLELGKSPVQKIATQAGVNRATTYVQIESLIKKGMMSTYKQGNKQFYFAESPEKLSLLFREEAMAIQRKQEYLDKLLPQLRSINAEDKDRPTVRYFEGKAGMRAIAEEMFLQKSEDTMRMIFSQDLLLEMFSEEELKKMRSKRKDKKIRAVVITNDEKNRLDTDANIFRVDSKKFPISADIAFLGSKTRIVTQKGNQVGLIIDNKEISNTFKTLYTLAIKYLDSKMKKRV